jgi:hypothetical protein
LVLIREIRGFFLLLNSCVCPVFRLVKSPESIIN